MSFWERSDSQLDDETNRALRTGPWPLGSKDVRRALDHIVTAPYYRTSPRTIGTFNRCWLISPCEEDGFFDLQAQHLIARFNIHPSPSMQSLHLEQWVNNEALARDFPTPRIIHVDTSLKHCRYPFQVIEYSDGMPLRGQTEEVVHKVLAQLARELRKLHDVAVGDRFGRVGLGTVPEWDMFLTDGFADHQDYCREHNLIDEDQWLEITVYTASDEILECAAPSLLHADLSYDNILLDRTTNDLKAVIDWEDAVLGDPIFELAGLATFHPEERHKVILDAYYQDDERPDDLMYRFWIYYLRIALAKAVHRHRFGYSDAGGEGRQAADQRISLALGHLKDLS